MDRWAEPPTKTTSFGGILRIARHKIFFIDAYLAVLGLLFAISLLWLAQWFL